MSQHSQPEAIVGPCPKCGRPFATAHRQLADLSFAIRDTVANLLAEPNDSTAKEILAGTPEAAMDKLATGWDEMETQLSERHAELERLQQLNSALHDDDIVFQFKRAESAEAELASIREELAHMRTTDAVQDRQALIENNKALDAELAKVRGERDRLQAQHEQDQLAVAYAPENAWHDLTKAGIEFYEIDGDGEPYDEPRKIVYVEDKGDRSVGIGPSAWWQAAMPKAGERDHFMMCGKFAIEALGLGDDENSPAEVRERIEQLSEQAAELVKVRGERDEARARLLTAAGDDLCRLSQEEIKAMSAGVVPIPPKDEFLASCERFHAQVAGESGVNTNCLTLAQLIAESEKLRQRAEAAEAQLAQAGNGYAEHVANLIGYQPRLKGEAPNWQWHMEWNSIDVELVRMANDAEALREQLLALHTEAGFLRGTLLGLKGQVGDELGQKIEEALAAPPATEPLRERLEKALEKCRGWFSEIVEISDQYNSFQVGVRYRDALESTIGELTAALAPAGKGVGD